MLGVGLMFGAVAVAIWGVSVYRQGQANLRACGDLEPGGQRSDLIQVLGVPWSTKANPAKTRLILTFPGSLLPVKPLHAVVNVRDDVVMEVDCGDGRIKTHDKY